MVKIFESDALDDLMYWANNDRKILNKIHKLLRDIERNGAANGEGKPERLRHRQAWSRRIDHANRLVYEVKDDRLYIFSCKGHYDD